MEKQLNLPDHVEKFMNTFRKAGFEIFVVGGSIRDMLLGKDVYDFDFATSATPEQMLELLPHAKYENDFGTVLVPLDEIDRNNSTSGIFEITPFRKEGKYKDSRHPEEVVWADSIEEDVQRRDFTINALAFDGTKLVDITGGKNDLTNSIIRAVGDPNKRFEEDALRMMRAIRFASQLGFTIDPDTLSAIQSNAKSIKNISWERISDEFLKMIGAESVENAGDGVMLLKDTGILVEILPELNRCFGVEQKSPGRHHTDDVGTHLVKSLKNCPSPDPIVRFATLIHDIGKAETRDVDEETGITTFYNHEIVGATIANNIAERFRLSKKNRFKLVKLVRYHMFSVSEDQTDKAVRRFIRKVGSENIGDMLDLRTGDRLGSGVPETSWRTELFKKRIVEVQQRPFEIRDLKIGGEDVMNELNVKPGPRIGEILKEVFELVADNQLENDRSTLMKYLTKHY